MPSDRDFDAMDAIGRSAAEHPEWPAFAPFCMARARGLRAEAFLALDAFLRHAAPWPFDKRREFIRWLMARRRSFSVGEILTPQPLYARLLAPTVQEWCSQEPENAQPWLFRGLLGCDDPSASLGRALELDPTCEEARQMLAQWIVADIQYNQHHMPDFYINDPRLDLAALERVGGLVAGSTDLAWAEITQQEASELRAIATTWLAAHPREGDFGA
jgi:hypothetical protein